MSNGPERHAAAMEGQGAYNVHSALQASAWALAIPLLVEAARQIPIDSTERPLVLADYGSSQGKNSLAPLRTAISTLRARGSRDRPLFVFHTDLPANDFSELFRVLEDDPDSYLRRDNRVFSYAVGRSFYRQLFPQDCVDLGWSSYAALWLSQIPIRIPDHFYIPCSGGAVRAEFERQAALDWKLFLSLRATELRPGGRLVVVLPLLEEDGSTVWQEIMDDANAALSELVALEAITREERRSMTLANCPRRQTDLLAPFLGTGEFEGLVVERCGTFTAPDAAWTEYESDGDAASLARKRALFFRATFVPSLLPGLAPTRDAEEKTSFADRLQAALQRRLERRPAPVAQLVGTIVVKKQTGVESRR